MTGNRGRSEAVTVLLVTLIHAAAGPPAGAIAFGGLVGFLDLGSSDVSDMIDVATLLLVPEFAAIVYALGVLPAIGTGLAAGLRGYAGGRNRALMAGLVVGPIASALLIAIVLAVAGVAEDLFLALVAMAAGSGLSAALVCHGLTRFLLPSGAQPSHPPVVP